jgi:hypothetical protein
MVKKGKTLWNVSIICKLIFYISAQFENPLEKREQFAVSLRKKKTQEIVKAKRRKIIEALSKGKKQYSGFGDSGNSVLDLVPDNEVSLQDMENQFYQGYPKWRKDDYKEQKDILLKLISKPDFDLYDKASNVSN